MLHRLIHVKSIPSADDVSLLSDQAILIQCGLSYIQIFIIEP